MVSVPARSDGDPAEFREAFDALERLVAADLTATADSGRLDALMAGVRRIEGLVARLTVQIASRSIDLADDGADPVSTLLGQGREVSGRHARREAARADLIAWWPEVGEALAAGAMSATMVDALARQTARLDDTQRSALPRAELLEAINLPVDTFSRLVGRVVARIETEGPTPVNKRAQSSFRHWFDDASGMGRFAGAFDPERYEAFVTAIEQRLAAIAGRPTDNDGPETRPADRTRGPGLAATALLDLVTGSSGRRPHLPHITVVVGPDGRAETGDGHPLSGSAADRLACDAVLQRVRHDTSGVPIDVGRRVRTATAAQWTAIRSLHRACAWSGCDQPLSRCQLHHIRPWAKGGPTDLANLLPLCSRHHHLVHDGGWAVELAPDRSLIVRRPDGSLHSTTPRPSRAPPHQRAA